MRRDNQRSSWGSTGRAAVVIVALLVLSGSAVLWLYPFDDDGLPLERLMVETDAPFLAPEGHRGKRNEPAWVPRIGETLAHLHDVPLEEVARITTRNAQRFYRVGEARA